MEGLQFQFTALSPNPRLSESVSLCGVVASGNLEVLVERHGEDPYCRFVIQTAAEGFGDIWTAVLKEFSNQHAVGGLTFSINDVGATPAIVSLRLRQALELWDAEARGAH